MAVSSAISGILVDQRLAETLAQRVVVDEQAVDLGAEVLQVAQILHTDGAAADLVLVGRTDAAPRGADLLAAGAGLAQLVELAVQRQDQRGVLGDLQVVRGDVDALRADALDLARQMPGIDDDAVADDAEACHRARRPRAAARACRSCRR